MKKILGLVKSFIQNRPVLKRIILRLYFDSGYGLNYHSIPFHFGKIPQYYLSRLASWIYGNNILNRQKESKIQLWLHGGSKTPTNVVWDSVPRNNIKGLRDSIEGKKFCLKPFVDFCNSKYPPGALLKVLDMGCGAGITSMALAER